MQKILILAEDPIKTKLEEKLRRRFDVESVSPPLNGICEIKCASVESGSLSVVFHQMKTSAI